MDIKRHLLAFFPESPSFLGLNELTMKFKGDREAAYLREGMETFLTKKRLGLLLGIIMFALFALIDLVLAPKVIGPLLFIRFGITAAILFFVLSLSYIDRVRPRFHKLIFAAVLVMNLSHLLVFTRLPLDLLPRYHFSYLILIVYSAFMMATNFLNTALATLISVFFYIGYLSFSPVLLTEDKLLFSVVAAVLAFIVILAVYYAEYLSRRSYVLEGRLGSRDGAEDREEPSPSKQVTKKEMTKKEMRSLRAEVEAELRAGLEAEIRTRIEGEVRAEADRDYGSREEKLARQLEAERKNYALLAKELEEQRLGEYERRQSQEALLRDREAAFLKEKEALLRDKDGAYEDFKKGQLKDYEQKLNALNKELGVKEARLKELEAFNKNLMADMDKAMSENKELKDREEIEILEKSFDDIKLMGRMGSFASSSMVKNINESMNYFDENQDEFRSDCSLQFLNLTNNRMRENLYIAGAMKYRFDLFRLYLTNKLDREAKTEVASSVQRAFSKLSKFFEGTNHYVDVTCKDGVLVRMEDEGLDLILQNLVMSSLASAARLGESAHIIINVKEEKSKVIIEYQDEGKSYATYYKEILKLKKIHSDIVSVSGLEVFFIRDLIKRYTGGDIQIGGKSSSNKLIMSFIK